MKKSCPSRRQLLQSGIGLGCGLLIPGKATAANFHELSGAVRIDNRRASFGDDIRPGEVVSTGHTGASRSASATAATRVF